MSPPGLLGRGLRVIDAKPIAGKRAELRAAISRPNPLPLLSARRTHSLDATFSYKETICKRMAEPVWPYRPWIIQRTRPPSVAQFFARLRLVRRGQPQNGLLPPLTQPLLAVQRAELLHLDRNAPTLSPRPPKANLGPIFSISKRFRLDDLNQDAKIDIGLS